MNSEILEHGIQLYRKGCRCEICINGKRANSKMQRLQVKLLAKQLEVEN